MFRLTSFQNCHLRREQSKFLRIAELPVVQLPVEVMHGSGEHFSGSGLSVQQQDVGTGRALRVTGFREFRMRTRHQNG